MMPALEERVAAMSASDRPETADRPEAPERNDVALCAWDRVVRARTALAVQRRTPARNGNAGHAQAELLDALEAYAVSLTDRGRPIPYALRDELRLRRLTR